ncbi:MAG: hypothetical protein LBE08_12365 [Bifidobacteriaceae bacterium]|nr:hypothetical protein [Bifidobacteriaceae bacterium]
MLNLTSDYSWLQRRIETIDMRDREVWDHQVSIDIDIADLRERALRVGLADTRVIPLPIGKLTKSLLPDFDLRAASGDALRVISRDLDSVVSRELMVAAAQSHRLFVGQPVTRADRDALYQVAWRMPAPNDFDVLADPNDDWSEVRYWADLDPAWRRLLHSIRFRKVVADCARNFRPIIEIDLDEFDGLVKYRVAIPGQWRGPANLRQWLGLRNTSVKIDLPVLGEARSDHIRFNVPPGVQVAELPGVFTGVENSEVDLPEIIASTAPGGVTLNVREGDKVKDTVANQVLVPVRPHLRGFLKPSLASLSGAWIILASLFIGQVAGFHTVEQILLPTDGGISAETLVTALLVALTAFVGYLGVKEEHEARSILLRLPRHVVFGAVSIAALWGLMLVIPGLDFDTVFLWQGVALGVITVCIAYLCILDARCRSWHSGIVANLNSTLTCPRTPVLAK